MTETVTTTLVSSLVPEQLEMRFTVASGRVVWANVTAEECLAVADRGCGAFFWKLPTPQGALPAGACDKGRGESSDNQQHHW